MNNKKQLPALVEKLLEPKEEMTHEEREEFLKTAAENLRKLKEEKSEEEE